MRVKKSFLFMGLFFFIPFAFATFRTNPTVDIHFQNVPIRPALTWLFAYADKNIVLGPTVEGKLTIALRHIRIQKALSIILRTHQLKQEERDQVLYITPKEEANRDKKDNPNPSKTLWIRLNHAKATGISKLLKTENLLSKRGIILSDERTNSLWIKDNIDRLSQLKAFIRTIDISMPQVLIETRIVNIDDDYEKELGARLGMTHRHFGGALEGETAISSGSKGVPIKNGLNIDLPVTASGAGHFALFTLNKAILLDAELSALEKEGHAEIISTPQLLTGNQQTAYVEAGEEIPYQESVSQGVTTTAFKKAVLRLQVTPHIMSGKKILLQLKVNQDKRSNKEILGVPAIDTRQIATKVSISDGQTLVLGGIYEQIKTKMTNRMPFISDLPIIGVLFQHKRNINNRRELLIFVTPKIITTE